MATEPATSTGTLTDPEPQHAPRRIDEFLRDIIVKGGSDLHFVAGDPPRIRLHGELQPLREQKLDREAAREMIMEVTLQYADGRTEVTMAFHNLPPGIRPEDNDAGTRSSLDKLARYLEAHPAAGAGDISDR